MSAENDVKNLLPTHLSELELRLERALARLADVHIPTSTLWNPALCPVEALPYLAWALSVDEWNSEWDEQTKRRVIADAKFIHERKGTRPAVEKAISSITADEVKLIEWFEAPSDHEPAEFSVETVSGSEGIDIALLRQIIPQINSAKNVRSHLKKISVTTRSELTQKHATVSRQALSAKSGTWLIKSLISQTDNKLVTVSRNSLNARSGVWLISSLISNAAKKPLCASRQQIIVRSGALPLQ